MAHKAVRLGVDGDYAHFVSPLAEKEQVMLIDMLERICSELEETARAPMNKVLPAD